MTPLLVALGAGIGAPLRFALASFLDSDRFPLGVWLANVVGSTLLGLLVGLDVGAHPIALLGVGFCGGFTTYSAFATESFDRGVRVGGWYAVATVAVALGGCGLGYWVGAALG